MIVVSCSDQWHDLRTMAILGLGKICTVAPDQTNWPISSYPAMCMDLFMWIWSNLCPPVDLLVRVCVCGVKLWFVLLLCNMMKQAPVASELVGVCLHGKASLPCIS